MIRIISSLIFVFLLSCKEQPKKTSYNQNEAFENSKKSKNLGDTIIISAKYPSIIKEIPAKENYLNNFEKVDLTKVKEWIEIKKDKQGYLIYDGCDENTFGFEFKNKDSVKINFRFEPLTSIIKNFSKSRLYNGIFDFEYYDYFTEKFEKVTIEHYEANIPVYKCKMRDWAFLVTPKHDEKYFRKIINDCYEKTGESEFETVK